MNWYEDPDFAAWPISGGPFSWVKVKAQSLCTWKALGFAIVAEKLQFLFFILFLTGEAGSD